MKKFFLLLTIFSWGGFLKSQPATIGLLQYGSGNLPGYVLYNPSNYTSTYLIDKCGYKIREWQSSYTAGHSAYLLADGSLLRAGNVGNTSFNQGGKGGIIEKYDFNGNLTWSYQISSTTELQHHDICPLPNGNVLALVWQKKANAIATAQGRDPSLLGMGPYMWEEVVKEIQPVGLNNANIVWEWHAWNHIIQDFDSTKANYGVVADHPELLNFNYTNGSTMADWMHMNGIDYDPVHDQIVLSSRQLCEIYVIDHSTNTAQATSHAGGNYGKGGDLLYRYGNPEAYNRGTLTDRVFYFQHCARWIKTGEPWAGKISVFNNGVGRPGGNYSTVDVINPPVDANWNYLLNTGQAYGPSSIYWSYADPVPANFYSNVVSGAFAMSNGNFIVTEGQSGNLFEVDTLKNKIWDYQNPVNSSGPQTQGTTITGATVFKASFYDVNFPGFNSQTMTPGLPVELNPIASSCSMVTTGLEENNMKTSIHLYPNPAKNEITVEQISEGEITIVLTDINGKIISSQKNTAGINKISLAGFKSGLYLLHTINNAGHSVHKIVKSEE